MDATCRMPGERFVTRRAFLSGLAASAALGALTACSGPRRASNVTPTITGVTPTSTPSVPPIPGPPRPTTAPLPTATALPPALTATPAPLVDATAVWTDPRGLIRLRYPDAWRTGIVGADAPGGGRAGNILQLSVPYEGNAAGWPALWLDLHEPHRGTLADAVQRARDAWVGKPYTLTDQRVGELTVGDEPAKQFTFIYTPNFNPTYHLIGRDVFVNHAGREFFIEVNGITTDDRDAATRQRAIDQIIASIRFLT